MWMKKRGLKLTSRAWITQYQVPVAVVMLKLGFQFYSYPFEKKGISRKYFYFISYDVGKLTLKLINHLIYVEIMWDFCENGIH